MLPDNCVLIARQFDKDTTNMATFCPLVSKTNTTAIFYNQRSQSHERNWTKIASPETPPRQIIVEKQVDN